MMETRSTLLDTKSKSVSIFHLNKRQLFLLLFLAILVLCRNLLLMVHGFGEPDSARFMNDAIMWHFTDNMPFTDYRAKVSPGYIYLIKSLIDLNINYTRIIDILNITNALFGAILIFLSFFFFRLFFEFIIALFCAIILSFVPSIFIFSIYGFPTLIAYALFIFSLLLFTKATTTKADMQKLFLIFSAVGLCLGTILKADILLLCGGFFGVLITLNEFSAKNISKAIIIIILGTGAPFLFKDYFLPDTTTHITNFGNYAQHWNDRFTYSIKYFISNENVGIVVRSFGKVFVLAALAGCLIAIKHKDKRRLLWMIILFAAPVVIFWGGRPGNSARHVMGASLPLIIPIGIVLETLKVRLPNKSVFAISSFLIIIANYFSTSANPSTVRPSSRLIASALQLRSSVSTHMQMGREIAKTPAHKNYLIDSFLLPYEFFNVFKNTRSINKWSVNTNTNLAPHSGFFDFFLSNGKNILLYWSYVKSQTKADSLAKEKREKGFVIWSEQYKSKPISNNKSEK